MGMTPLAKKKKKELLEIAPSIIITPFRECWKTGGSESLP